MDDGFNMSAQQKVLEDPNLLNNIFKKLQAGDFEDVCRAARVCQSWADAANQREFWKDIRIPRGTMSLSKARMLFAHAHHIQTLDVRELNLPDDALVSLARSLPVLTQLKFQVPTTGCPGLLRAIEDCHHLDKLDIFGCGRSLVRSPPAIPHHPQAPSVQNQQQQEQIFVNAAGPGLVQHAVPQQQQLGHIAAPPPLADINVLHEQAMEDIVMVVVSDDDTDMDDEDDLPIPWMAHPVAQHHAAADNNDIAIRSTTLRVLTMTDVYCRQLTLDVRNLHTLVVYKLDVGGRMIMNPAPQLRNLVMKSCNKMSLNVLRALPRVINSPDGQNGLPSLTSLQFEDIPKLNDDLLGLCGTRLTNIQSLHISHCNAVTGTGLRAPGWANLQTLHIKMCDGLTKDELHTSVRHMPCLEELAVFGCSQLTTLTIESRTLTQIHLSGNRCTTEMSLNCSRLEELTASPLTQGCAAMAGLRTASIASSSLPRLKFNNFPALRSLDLHCPRLEELDLAECSALNGSIFSLQNTCPTLRVLKFEECPGLKHLTLKSPSLETIRINRCENLTQVDVECGMLRKVIVTENISLDSIVLHTSRMETLSLNTCGYLTKLQLTSPSLKALDISGCNSLSSLKLSCPALINFVAEFCGQLSNAAMQELAKCTNLEYVNLSTCTSVTLQGIAKLATLTKLKILDVSRTMLEDVLPMLPACTNLTALHLSNNPSLQPEGLRSLLSQLEFGKLKFLDISYCKLPASLLADIAVDGGLETLVMSGAVTDDVPPLLHYAEDGQDNDGMQTDEIVRMKRGSSSTLQSLHIMGCKDVSRFYLGTSPDCRRVVPTPLSDLKELRLNVLKNLKQVYLSLPELTSLQLENNLALADVRLRCPKLTSLSLQGCSALTSMDVQCLVATCPQLRELDIRNWAGDGQPVKAALLALKPELEIKLHSVRRPIQ